MQRPCIQYLASCILLISTPAFAAQEMLKTSRVKVGERVQLTETLKKANNEGKVIVLVLFPNPLGCDGCDAFIKVLEEESAHSTDVAYIMAGGQDIMGAMGGETAELKRLYGFVTMGKPWTFIIDKEGVLRGIFIGPIGKEELRGIMDSIIGGKI